MVLLVCGVVRVLNLLGLKIQAQEVFSFMNMRRLAAAVSSGFLRHRGRGIIKG